VFLEVEHRAIVECPDDAAIERALRRLVARRVDWVALSTDRRRSSLLSASRGQRGLVVECVGDRVRRCRKELPPEQVITAFKAFARDERSWQLELPWRDATGDGWWVYPLLAAVTGWTGWVLWPRIVVVLERLGLK
jgi:hypothetical protein